MRTTLTLEADVEALVKRHMRERGLSFKDAVNQAIRAGLDPGAQGAARTPTYSMGEPKLPLEKALALAGAFEDDELARRLAARK